MKEVRWEFVERPRAKEEQIKTAGEGRRETKKKTNESRHRR